MSVCIPTYMLAASMIEAGMTWWQSVLTVLLGNLIVLVPMILMGHAGTKYGIPFPVLARASFGTIGAHIPAIARSLVACGWFGIQTWIGGVAIYQALGALGWLDIAADTTLIPLLGITGLQFICFLTFWVLNFLIVLRGINCIKWLESWAAPLLIVMGLAMLIWAAVKVGGISKMFPPAPENPAPFWPMFFPQLTAMVGFWATLSLNIPDFTRYCKTQKDQALGQLIGLPTTMTLFFVHWHRSHVCNDCYFWQSDLASNCTRWRTWFNNCSSYFTDCNNHRNTLNKHCSKCCKPRKWICKPQSSENILQNWWDHHMHYWHHDYAMAFVQ